MTLRDTIDEYIAWQRAHGVKFEAGANVLHLFQKSIDGEIPCAAVSRAHVCMFLAGNGRLTRYRANKFSVLAGFFRYAISRRYAPSSPLPDNEPKSPSSPRPYIYSQDELRRLFGAIDVSRRGAVQLDAPTFRALLLLLYGAGLRRGEAQRLTLSDVDLSVAVLTVRDTKFYKSRLVPIGVHLIGVLREYAALRATRPLPQGNDSSFLANLDGTPVASGTLHGALARLLRAADITNTDGARQSPSYHAFRHSFAVNRVTTWYRQGADVQRLLPVLSTYLGHKNLTSTQVYLSMTPELLQEASLRLHRYVQGDNHA